MSYQYILLCFLGTIFLATATQVNGTNATLEPNAKLASLSCQTGSVTNVVNWEWYKDGQLLKDGGQYKIFNVNGTLDISNPTIKDSGAYTCLFHKNGLNFSTKVELFAAPLVQHFERSKNLVQGDNLIIECHAEGHPLPYVTWFKEMTPVDLTNPRVSVFRTGTGLDNATLSIKALDFADRANYMCVATNFAGTKNATVLVRVKDKLAALWPFLGICAEVAILCIIIFIYERRRAKKMEEEELNEKPSLDMTNSNDHKGKEDIRHRK